MVERYADILLVEDNFDDLELTLHTFGKNGMTNRIQVARDGAEALDLVFGNPGHNMGLRLILLDLKLPKVDGLEVLRQLKADPRTKAIPVVVLTSSQEERDLAASYQLGVNSYLVKPVDFEQFRQAIAYLHNYWLVLNQVPKA